MCQLNMALPCEANGWWVEGKRKNVYILRQLKAFFSNMYIYRYYLLLITESHCQAL